MPTLKFLLLPLLFAWLAAGPVQAEIKRKILTHDGVERSYLIKTPKGLLMRPRMMPLIVVLHGAGGNAEQMAANAGRTLKQLATQERWAIAYAETPNGVWNTEGGEVSGRLDPKPDDLGYLDAVISDISSHHSIDPSRIFVTGHSRGGQAAFLMACKSSHPVAGVASVAMTFPLHLASGCTSGPPVGAMVVLGTDDPIIPFEGGRIRIGMDERDAVLSAQDTLSFFRRRNGCPETATLRTRKNKHPDDGTTLLREEWTSCTGAPVIGIAIEGGGHGWPDGRRHFAFSENSREIDAGRQIFRFFESLP